MQLLSSGSWLTDLFIKIFGDQQGKPVGTFSLLHIFLILLSFGLPAIFYFTYKNRSDESKLKLLKVVTLIMPISYCIDYLLQPFYNGWTFDTMGGYFIGTDKLPFHICTLCGAILVPLCFFNHRFMKYRDVVVTWTLIAAGIYVVYPGGFLNHGPIYQYSIFQAYGFHMIMILWGSLMIMTRQVEFDLKKIYRVVIFFVLEFAWAGIGNLLYYPTEDFFFIISAIELPSWFPLGFLKGSGVEWLGIPIMCIAMSALGMLVYFAFYKINKARDLKGHNKFAVEAVTE